MPTNSFFANIKQTLYKKEVWWIYAVLLITIVLGVVRVHGSSVGMYQDYFYGNKVDKDLIFGQSRAIRSDEWSVITPLTISQYYNNYNRINTNIGIESDMSILYGIPSKHWSSVFKPSTWAFFITSLETAFAFRWWFRGAILIISAYLFLMKLLNKNLLLSIGGSLLFFFTPFIQWWYSVESIESITYIFFILYGFMNLFEAQKLSLHIAWAVFISYFAICFVLILYPPFQVSIGLAGLFFCAGYILNYLKLLNKKKIYLLLFSLAIILILVIPTIFFFYQDLQNVINIVLNTAYPGQRIITGGNYSIDILVLGFLNILLLKSSNIVPHDFANQCEASSFFMLYPFVVLTSTYYTVKNLVIKKKVDYILVFLSVYLLLGTIWILVGFPETIAKLTLLSFVPQNRMIIGIGTINYIIALYFISKIQLSNKTEQRIIPFILAVSAFVIFIYVGITLSNTFPNFFTAFPQIPAKAKIILIAIIPFLATFFLIQKNSKLFLFTILTYAIVSTFAVNPLYRGLDVLTNTKISKAIHSIESTNKSDKRWVVFGAGSTANYVIANGANSINSTHWYPQLELWKMFDPESKYSDTYNRYAHVSFYTDPDDDIQITLPEQDCVDVYINPCNTVFEDLDVEYYVFEEEVQYDCLNEISHVNTPAQDIYFYERSQ